MIDRDKFIEWFSRKYPLVSQSTRDHLLAYGDRLAGAGDRAGLLARGDLPRLYSRHLGESIAPELLALLPSGAHVVDVGSGGGLPGIPVALVRGDIGMTLLEPRERKAAFLERAVLELHLENVSVVAATVEEAALSNPSSWDVAVSRALVWKPTMVRSLEVVLRPEGVLLRFGSPEAAPNGVEVIPIEPERARAIQRWPRATWRSLPQAR